MPVTPPAGALARARAFLASSSVELEIYVDEAHHTYLELYLGRADALQVLRAPATDVLAELQRAARCYAVHAALFLERWPPHRLKSRRLGPLELALIAGDEDVLRMARERVAVGVMMVLAETEPEDITREVRALCGGTASQPAPSDPILLAGLLGVHYWLALSALLAGDVTGLAAVAALAEDARAAGRAQIRSGPAALRRLDALHRALAALPAGDPSAFADALVEHAAAVARERLPGTSFEGALDRTSLALVAAAAAVGIDARSALQSRVGTPTLAPLAAYLPLLA